MKLAVLAVAALLVIPVTASAAPGGFRVIEGRLVSLPAPPGPAVARVDGDDGVSYYADLRGARWDPSRLRVGDRVALAGYEGARPNELIAAVLDPSEELPAASAATAPPAVAVVPPAPPPSQPPAGAVPPTATAPRPEREPPEQIKGRVERIAESSVVVRTPDDHEVTVDLSQIGADARHSLRRGDELTVYGRFTDDQRLVATGFYTVHTPRTP